MELRNIPKSEKYFGYDCWLRYEKYSEGDKINEYKEICRNITSLSEKVVVKTAVGELKAAINKMFGFEVQVSNNELNVSHILVGEQEDFEACGIKLSLGELGQEGFAIKKVEKDNNQTLMIIGKDANGVLYGVFHLIKAIGRGVSLSNIETIEKPKNYLRMIDHWDNISGDIERGYAGKSIFFSDNKIIKEVDRIIDYARLLASIGINALTINNVNVHQYETKFLTDEYLPDIARFADVFRNYGIKLYLSINFASPIEIDGLTTADPLDESVKAWWRKTAEKIHSYIPDFGGFLVKADSEYRPGPFTYGRDHADGANMLAEALKPFNGLVIWRCFVYNCQLNWRDRSKDRAKAAYENFKPLDGKFSDNVILQVKNGPMDFQIREPISPLFGTMEKTNEAMEFQIAQEYTGQQKHICYLVPLWKECLEFDTYAKGEGSLVKNVVDGSLFNRKYGGITAVSNLGNDENWAGHPLAQANFYGFGRLAWNPDLTSEEIAEEWIKLTFGCDEKVIKTILSMLLESRDAYEKYTCPLGIGWMVNPSHHYGPSVDGYEYSPWGTYHYADFKGFGVDRTVATGTGYTAQYNSPVNEIYEDINKCPEELLLFFHHVPYEYKLKTGKTVIQHIYDTHFEGAQKVEEFKEKWLSMTGKIDDGVYEEVLKRLEIQIRDSKEWRDVVNTYFYRRTGIKDVQGRKIYE